MLLSMTGYGEARFHSDALTVAIELRAVNNRYLKVMLRATEPYNLLEPEFEKVIRREVRRGTVQVHLRLERQFAPQDFHINATALRSYLSQVQQVIQDMNLPQQGDAILGQVLMLPGVVPEPGGVTTPLESEWPIIEKVLRQAVDKLQAMRQEEGRAMALEMAQHRDFIAAHLAKIQERVPIVALTFRDRLLERVRNLLREVDVKIDQSDLIKEVSIFAERSDIAEETMRLASHLDQFRDTMNEPESPGRKLEFLTQEMVRETNTIGSKAGDVDISRHVVEIKGALEKIRELVQNVE
ncbi:MAG: YicC/YloC family endoribonuclease [Gemmataceae bacterium]